MLFWLRRYKYKSNPKLQSKQNKKHEEQDNAKTSSDLAVNLAELRSRFYETPDLIVRPFYSQQLKCKVALCYLDGLTDKNALNTYILRPLMFTDNKEEEALVNIGDIKYIRKWEQIDDSLLNGFSLLFIEGNSQVTIYNTQGWPQRAIEDPQLEASIKGGHQGFVETGGKNIALIRRYVTDRNLKIRELKIGKRAESTISILYIADIARPELLKMLEARIRKVDVDFILNTGELAELIEDNPYSPFPQFGLTERPDAAASQLMQGRMCIVVDRSPSVIIAPMTMTAFFQSVDDYSTRWLTASFIRLLRFFAFFVAVFLPALYIAVISFNYEIIPLNLLLSIGESRGQVPFPPILEALIMELTLEMLREAGIRLPAPIGQTVGIVGGIVIGQTAVQAGIVSNIMVVVVALTGISSFIIPNYDMSSAIRLIRFPMMLIASIFGVFGVALGWMILIAHLISLESLGTPYGSPLAPFRFKDMKDTFIRLPLWTMKSRPTSARPIQDQRAGNSQPKGNEK
nr:spore germination protein [Paenibacillus psychroresistens]